ncbi:MAG: YgdI/YgdR family lipoprotein [Prosthecobacter sp.]|nr:YgdI/YgdR family lipoprotein [Prosthecobacter sp.]
MRLKSPLPSLALAVLFLAGCQAPSSSVSYKITLKDGREYLSSGRPEYQRKTGYYRYRTFQKRDALLRADEVLMIEEQGV